MNAALVDPQQDPELLREVARRKNDEVVALRLLLQEAKGLLKHEGCSASRCTACDLRTRIDAALK